LRGGKPQLRRINRSITATREDASEKNSGRAQAKSSYGIDRGICAKVPPTLGDLKLGSATEGYRGKGGEKDHRPKIIRERNNEEEEFIPLSKTGYARKKERTTQK